MASYDNETLYLSEMYMSGVLLQVAADTIAELVSLTGDASFLERFYQQILEKDWIDTVATQGKIANPMRKKMAVGLMKQRLPEVVGVLRNYAELAEKEYKSRSAN